MNHPIADAACTKWCQTCRFSQSFYERIWLCLSSLATRPALMFGGSMHANFAGGLSLINTIPNLMISRTNIRVYSCFIYGKPNWYKVIGWRTHARKHTHTRVWTDSPLVTGQLTESSGEYTEWFRRKCQYLRCDSNGHCEGKKVHMNTSVPLNGNRDTAVSIYKYKKHCEW